MPNQDQTIAYFSLEIGLESSIPTYSGGLGVLAGDTIRAAADLGLPLVAVTLLYRKGYFRQQLDADGQQTELPVAWNPDDVLEEMPQRAFVPIDGRDVMLRAYRLWIDGCTGHRVPVYLLDTDLDKNDDAARTLTHSLYAGDPDHRVRQEAVLAIGGKRMLRALTHDVAVHHMNEGHAFLVTLELLSEHLSRYQKQQIDAAAIAYARDRCVFTTHTPVPAGHDRFDVGMVRSIVGDHPLLRRPDLYGEAEAGSAASASDNVLNTTKVALNLSRFANAVAQKHGEVSREMFPGYPIAAITNGVHAATWTSPSMRELFDRAVPKWRRSNSDLRLVQGVPAEAIREAHAASKRALLAEVGRRVGRAFDPGAFTVAFARRATAYKRPAMLLSDLDRIAWLAERVGPLQVLYAGKAHPHDGTGAGIIREIVRKGRDLEGKVEVVFCENYDIDLCRLLVAGVDLWLNNPEPPLEASGTSGMKAALNGVPSLSTLDGWWLEGWVEGVTGWAIEGEADSAAELYAVHADSLYDKLANSIMPMYYREPERWAEVMRSCVAINGSYFTTERMVREYGLRAYWS